MPDHDPTTVDPSDLLLLRVFEIQGLVAEAMPAVPVTDITGADRSLRYAYGFLTQLADQIRDLRAAGRLLPEGGQTPREEFGYRYRARGRDWTKVSPTYDIEEADRLADEVFNLGAEVEVLRRFVLTGPWEPVPDTDGGEP